MNDDMINLQPSLEATLKLATKSDSDSIYNVVVDKLYGESDDVNNCLLTRIKGGFFYAVLVRCACFVAILVGLLGGGNMSVGKVEAIDEEDLMKWTNEQRMIAGEYRALKQRRRERAKYRNQRPTYTSFSRTSEIDCLIERVYAELSFAQREFFVVESLTLKINSRFLRLTLLINISLGVRESVDIYDAETENWARGS